MISMLWLLLCICLTSANRSYKFNRAILHFEISSSDPYKFIVSCGNTTYKLSNDLKVEDSYATKFSPPNSTFVYVDGSYVVECGTSEKCCTNRTLDNFNEVFRSKNSDITACIDYFSTTYHVNFYPYTHHGNFYVLTSYDADVASASRLYYTTGPVFESNKAFGGGLAELPLVISPPSRFMDEYTVCLKSIISEEIQYYMPTKAQTGHYTSMSLECDGYNMRGISGTALPGQSNALKINKGVINYLRTAHFIIIFNKTSKTSSKTSNKLCVFTEDDFEDGNLVSKKNIFELVSQYRIKAMDVVVVNDELCLYYTINKSVYKIVLTESDMKFRSVDSSTDAIFIAKATIRKIIVPVAGRGYIMTDRMVEEFSPYNCSKWTMCKSCVGADDPHCGWCTMEAKCSIKDQCTVLTQWTKKNDMCLIFSVEPANEQIRDGIMLQVNVTGITLLENNDYICRFNGEKNTTATYSNAVVTCLIPSLPSITEGNKEIEVQVLYTTILLGAVTVTYHQCDKYNDCKSCSGIGKFCTWCPYSGQCTLQNEALCDSSAVKKPGKCPFITSVSPAYIDRQTITNIQLDVSNLPPFQYGGTNYRCLVSSKVGTHTTLHTIMKSSTNTTIICNDIEVDDKFAEHNSSQANVSISIVYHSSSGSVVIVSSEFTVYSCTLLSTDCVGCISTYSASPYSCKWCTNQCAYGSSSVCGSGIVIDTDAYKCLDWTEVTQVIPNWSPREGGVKVQVIGESMAIQSGVKVQFTFNSGNPITCTETIYIDSKRLDCKTPNVMSQTPDSDNMIIGTVRLLYPSGEKKEMFNSTTKFNFTKLHIGPFLPTIGPMSGGTVLTMQGMYLCQGNTSVTIGGSQCTSVKCKVVALGQELSCKTPSGAGNQRIKVMVGAGSTTSGPMKTYTYSEDPIVTSITPRYTLAKGGINITVTGMYFNIIASPILLIGQWSTSRGRDLCIQSEHIIDAINRTDTTLMYSLPPFDTAKGTPHIAFKMDNVTDLCKKNINITVLENPAAIANNLDIPCIQGKECLVKIQMSHISPFDGQLVIIVGNVKCRNTTLFRIKGDINEVTCIPPDWNELKSHSRRRRDTVVVTPDTEGEYNVTVVIGYFSSNIGVITYQVQTFPWLYVYIAVGGVVVLMGIIMALFVKNKMSDKKLVQLEDHHNKQLDQIERVHIDRAKAGFHQLTVMPPSKMLADAQIDPNNIPYRMFSDYLLHIMFPKVDKVKMAQSLNLEHTDISDYEVSEFAKLLKNKVFLINFISTIEQQTDFQVANRCEVASYLTVALYNDFNYLSNALFWFMDSLIDKHIANKSHPKLLLRSTSSVAEKLLTNWLSLSLYGYVKECTGPALYSLCCAILNTAENGPIDYVTHQAQFALSQDKLLTEKVQYERLQVRGEGPDGAKATLTILDCDTITQAKGKVYRAIYKHSPHSQQPNLAEMSLLWYSGQGSGNMELSDDDERLMDGNQFNQYNTIKSYKIREGELLKLTVFNEFHQAPIGTLRKKVAVDVVERHHIVKNEENDFQSYRSPAVQRQQTQHTLVNTKLTSELFLTDLINTKNCIIHELHRLVKTIFMESNNLPPAIKYLFDYLDNKLANLPIEFRSDSEIPHVWKTNSLHLRFWVNIMKNPEFIFDIHKPTIMDSYLSVMAQCFMDSCSPSQQHLNKDAPANKQLFNSEVKQYKDTVTKWYSEVKTQCNQVTIRHVVNDSKLPYPPFKSKFAVAELYKYGRKYQTEILKSLPFQGPDGTRADFEVLIKKQFSTL